MLRICLFIVAALIVGGANGEAEAASSKRPVTKVGTVSFLMTDDSRRDPVDATHARQWMVQLYYPARATKLMGVYAADPVLLEEMVRQKYYDVSESDLRSWAKTPAFAAEGARPASGASLPVIVLSPGMGFARLNYAELSAALVKRDYAVAVVDHPYIGTSHLPDGRLIRADDDPALAADDMDLLTGRIRDWSQDVSTVISSYLSDTKKLRSIAPGLRINQRRLAVAGHSVGGAVAMDVCAVDARPIACLNFEGALFGSRAETHGVKKPALTVLSRAKGRPAGPSMTDQIFAALGKAGGNSIWFVKITGGAHTSYSDAPEVMPETLSRFGGELMSSQRSFEVYGGITDAFVHAYGPGGGGDAAFRKFLTATPEAEGVEITDPR